MIEISSDKTKLDIDYVHKFLKTSYWAEGIERDILQKSIDNSFCFGIYRGSKQLGFARVITDFTTVAYLADVFVEPDEQGKGLGRRLIRHILEREELQGLKHWHLITADAQPFYREHGFSALSDPAKHMECRIRPVCQE